MASRHYALCHKKTRHWMAQHEIVKQLPHDCIWLLCSIFSFHFSSNPTISPYRGTTKWWVHLDTCTLLFKSNGILFLRWQNMVFSFKVQTFVCGMRRSFAFTMENILSVWYTATPGWTSKFGKVWKTRCQNAATRANMAMFSCFMRWQILMSDGQQ